ncbi:MAG: LLM class flavin-dependent oxidoreductase [Frankiales bacterium]|nr:LLM class flavin-dependent oxidoreductase [Frankiales bacterium]
MCRSTSALLRGERLPDAVEGARPLALQCPPPAPVPLALAAVTTPSIRLAGAVADQWLPFLLPATALDDGRAELVRTAAQHERPAPTVTACVPLAIAADERGAERLAAQWLLAYTTRMGPVYPRVLRAHGYGPEIDALLAANDDPRSPVLPSAARRLAEDVLLLGTHEEAPALCRRWAGHADAIALVLPFASDEDDLLAVVDATAPGPGAAAS